MLTEPNETNVNDGDCQDCSGTGGAYEKNDQNEWEVTGDCKTCDGSGDAQK
ncbi:hypothetical protein [Anabaena azotica]|uniref:Molecular chaperone DnaJ n=1 Tax=Anabaena azotica FACHB-119 TaxID=947527 RepID=A0ABR8DAL2_9NOST|nr:hypothetical protein [Anabaena azotica]MBD2503952.1 hypothetical protein [Anabaena azotica FACHB-119]